MTYSETAKHNLTPFRSLPPSYSLSYLPTPSCLSLRFHRRSNFHRFSPPLVLLSPTVSTRSFTPPRPCFPLRSTRAVADLDLTLDQSTPTGVGHAKLSRLRITRWRPSSPARIRLRSLRSMSTTNKSSRKPTALQRMLFEANPLGTSSKNDSCSSPCIVY